MSNRESASSLNPVARIILTRTFQVGVGSVVALALLKRLLPPSHYRAVMQFSGPAVTAALSGYFATTFSPTARFPGDRFMFQLEKSTTPRVALTIDDGPDPETTPRLLDALAKSGPMGTPVPATFFLVAERARRFPRVVERIVDEGHTIGLHGLEHHTVALDNEDRITRDLDAAKRIVEDTIGLYLRDYLFRPPYGFRSWTLARTTARLGWMTVGWSCDSRDYTGITADQIVDGVASRIRPADIILLHERPGATATIEAVPRIITLCHGRNLECVELSL